MDFKMDKEFKINNHTDMDVNGLSGEITRFYPYAKEKLGFDKPVIVNLLSDPENSKNIFGKTAQYSPSNMTIDIFIDGRHPKDILRSLSHELVHHTQNCRGDFDNLGPTEKGYAQKDPFLRKLEAEAYLLGNGLLFRDFEDMRKSKMKTNENKFNLKDMIRNMLNETINEYIDTMETIEEDGYEDESMEEGAEMDVDEAKLPKNWRSLPTDHPSRVAFRKKYRARRAKSAKRKTRKRKDREMNFSDKEGGTIRTPTGTSPSSDESNALLQKLLSLTEPDKMFAKKDGKTSKPKAVARSKSKRKPDLADEIGIFTPKKTAKDALHCGEVGYLIAGIKDVHGAPVGDTITLAKQPATTPLTGFKKVQPQVFAGLFPIQADTYHAFRDALEKLSLNDASLTYMPENSEALGLGFRCGFLGMLHMEIIQERLEREYEIELITTAPTVIVELLKRDGTLQQINSPSELPEPNLIDEIREPIAIANILTPQEHVGSILTLCEEKRGVQKNLQVLGQQMSITYELPMNEIVLDFFDRVKSVSRGFASLDYHFIRYESARLVKLDVLINGDKVDALASIVHKDQAEKAGRALVVRLKALIPRQMFAIAIQAAIGGHIICRESIGALRKNVTAKCYGGDISRKKKLLKKQAAGKKRMKQIGSVHIPQEAFLTVLKHDDSGDNS